MSIGTNEGRPLAIPFGGPRVVTALTATSVAAFAVLMVLYRSGATKALDRAFQLQVREFRTEWLDFLAYWDDIIFRASWTFAAALMLAVILWRVGPRWSWCAPLAISFAVFAEAIVKNGFGQVLHPRAMLEGFLVLLGGHYHAPAAFPSGHVMRGMFLAIVALAYLPRPASIPLALFAATTLYARMYIEAHRLTDVFGGAFLGASVAFAAIGAVALLAAIERSRASSRPNPIVRWLGAWSVT